MCCVRPCLASPDDFAMQNGTHLTCEARDKRSGGVMRAGSSCPRLPFPRFYLQVQPNDLADMTVACLDARSRLHPLRSGPTAVQTAGKRLT